MKIMHIISGLSDGGAEAVLTRICLASYQYQHLVISMSDCGKYGRRLEQAGISVFTLNMPNQPKGRLTLSGLRRLWRLLCRECPDVVQTWMYHADLVGGSMSRLAGIRAVCWGIRHSNLESGKSSRSAILAGHLCAKLSRWIPSKIISCSQNAAELHKALGYDSQRIVVIPNGYDLSLFQPDPGAGRAIRHTLGLNAVRPLIGLVGRFDPQKDHAGLLAAFSRVLAAGYDTDLVLIGAGLNPENVTLNEWITALDLQDHVHLLGQRHDIPALMNALDLHVLSSCYGEAFPNVLAEAMACGTPCVTTDVGDAAMIVGDTGWVVPPSDPNALALAIQTALQARAQTQTWAERQHAARARIEKNFSLESMVSAYARVWENVIA